MLAPGVVVIVIGIVIIVPFRVEACGWVSVDVFAFNSLLLLLLALTAKLTTLS